MLREEVLSKWKDFKKRILAEEALLEELGSNLDDMKFTNSGYGCDIKESPGQVMEYLKEKLPSIVQSCQELRNKYINGQFGHETKMSLWILYVSYIGMVETYQKIIDFYNESGI